MKRLLCIGIIALMALIASQALASTITFGDSVKYWPTWPGHTAYNINDDAVDVVGNPNINGGTVVVDGHFLKSITFDYTVQNNEWAMLTPGNLFINVLNSPTDTIWDYTVTTLGYSTATPGNNKNTLAAGYYGLYNIVVDERKGTNNYAYILSGQDNTGIWSGYAIRDNHPVGIQSSSLGSKEGDIYYSGWPGKDPANINLGHSLYDFTGLNNGQGLDLMGKDIIIGWGPTCANDVVYEKVDIPAPEPGTILLLGFGLAALAGRQFMRGAKK